VLPEGHEPVEITLFKPLELPAAAPFGVSDGNFAIGEAAEDTSERTLSRSRILDRLRRDEDKGRTRREEESALGNRVRQSEEAANSSRTVTSGSASSASGKSTKLMSASPVGNYYIYSFDGRLLQVYDVYGALQKDFVYMGSRLVAEYDHVNARFLFYTPDQINSTRVVTDGVGNVVYSATYDPYGNVRTETGSVDPLLKFSNKERDAESQLDYFGARYYDRSQYRFISVDPKLILQSAEADSQRWSLYLYCSNNPINRIDPTGRWDSTVHYYWTMKTAVMAGFTPYQARKIAFFDNLVDSPIFSPKTTSLTPNEKQRKDWHFVSVERYFEALDICKSTMSLKESGKYLHVVQDFYAHLSVSWMGGSGHIGIAGIDDPYSNYHDWAQTMDMAQLTLDLMQAFRERIEALATSIATSLCGLISGGI
jgi:RHS repeat-associated protein